MGENNIFDLQEFICLAMLTNFDYLLELFQRKNAFADDCQKAIANEKKTKKTSKTYLNIDIKAECLRDFEATYQEGSDTYKSYFLGSNTK